jgi:medium-chain acyl-[acyl-carrier-protein] hydrolase
MTAVKNPWLVVSRRNPNAALRLFCFHYAGGNAYLFRTWHASLLPEVEVYGIQLPGRANRLLDSPCKRVPELFPELSDALVPLLNKPFVFFGHSMGALVAFETARWLRRNKQMLPAHLFVSGCQAPQIPDTDPPWHLMSDEVLLAEMVKLNGTPEEVMQDRSLLELALPILRADCELCETYTYEEEAALPCPITAFSGTDDDKVGHDKVEGWRSQTTREFAHHVFDGDHFFVRSKEPELLKLLKTKLSNIAIVNSMAMQSNA